MRATYIATAAMHVPLPFLTQNASANFLPHALTQMETKLHSNVNYIAGHLMNGMRSITKESRDGKKSSWLLTHSLNSCSPKKAMEK
jgi:hypothetical protein